MLQAILTLLVVLTVIAIPIIAVMGAVMYGSQAMGWGLHHHPRTAVAIVLFLALAAVLSYPHLFPGCTLRIGLGLFGRLAECASHSPQL
jgi:hypothetical protein